MNQMFVIARKGDTSRLELVHGEFNEKRVGEWFKRDPATCGSEEWVIVKIFDPDDHRKLAAMAELVGHTALAKIFKVDPFRRAHLMNIRPD